MSTVRACTPAPPALLGGALRTAGVRTPRGSVVVAAQKVTVCTNKDCKLRGSKKTLALFEAMCPEGVEVDEADCLMECDMGPNVCMEGELRTANGVKTPEDVAAFLKRNDIEPLDPPKAE